MKGSIRWFTLSSVESTTTYKTKWKTWALWVSLEFILNSSGSEGQCNIYGCLFKYFKFVSVTWNENKRSYLINLALDHCGNCGLSKGCSAEWFFWPLKPGCPARATAVLVKLWNDIAKKPPDMQVRWGSHSPVPSGHHALSEGIVESQSPRCRWASMNG